MAYNKDYKPIFVWRCYSCAKTVGAHAPAMRCPTCGSIRPGAVDEQACQVAEDGIMCVTHGCGPEDGNRCMRPECPHCKGV